MSNLYLNGFRDAFLGSGIVKNTLSSLKIFFEGLFTIVLFYYSFNVAKNKGTLINMGE